jgi:hypothetical protein
MLLESERTVLTLGEDSHSLDKMDATGKRVYAKLKEGHEFEGVRLQYDVATGRYELTGGPARLKSATAPCKYVEAPKLFLDPKTGTFETPPGSRKVVLDVSCTTPLSEIKR